MKQSQEKFVIDHLLKNDCISRNTCIQNFITRLGAIINRLNQQGWIIEGEWDITEKGRDYVYFLRKTPFKKVQYFVPVLNKTITQYEII
jgi:hypothetical protein